MKHYETAELSSPTAYDSDSELATLARKVAKEHFKPGTMSRSEFKGAVLRGEYPELVKAAVDNVCMARKAKAQATNEAAEFLPTLVPPTGFSLKLEGSTIVLSGAFDEDLHARIKRAGGVWDGMSGTNRRVWLIPAEKAKSLKRIFSNAAGAMAQNAQARAEQAEAARLADLQRWLSYVEEKAPEGYLYQRGIDECRARGINNHAELATRLDIAIQKAKEVRLAQEKQWAAERAEQQRTKQLARAATRPHRALFALGRGPALNVAVRVGSAVRVYTGTGKPFRINEDHPSLYGSHLLGHEGDMGCYYYWREATPDEISSLENDEAKRRAAVQASKARTARIRDLAESIRNEGQQPEGMHSPEGRCVIDTRTLYGGGDWFVIGETWIWYCQNNGADGDNWGANNVRTGGAGAIGWRVAYDRNLAAQLDQLADRGKAS